MSHSDAANSEQVRILLPHSEDSLKPLNGLYLSEFNVRAKEPCVYSNYVTSLDGRIAITGENGKQVPHHTANARDWRLFNELAAQADLLVTSGRYIRDLNNDNAQDLLPMINRPGLSDLIDWRLAQGLPPQPDVAVLTKDLSLTIPPELSQNRRAECFTTEGHMIDPAKFIRDRMNEGYRRIYLVTGGVLLHSFLSKNLVDRLYLTVVPRIIGGNPFVSICEGNTIDVPPVFRLDHLIHDPHSPAEAGQFFYRYSKRKPVSD